LIHVSHARSATSREGLVLGPQRAPPRRRRAKGKVQRRGERGREDDEGKGEGAGEQIDGMNGIVEEGVEGRREEDRWKS